MTQLIYQITYKVMKVLASIMMIAVLEVSGATKDKVSHRASSNYVRKNPLQ
jgi:hypothetical protein